MSPQQPNGVAVIIPVWNGMKDLPACLTALSKQQGVTFDIIAVDNASTDGSADYISEQWPDVRLIRNDANLGFACACNIGLKAANDRAVMVLLNQDTEVFADWLARLIAPMQHDASIGVAGGKALYPNGTIQHAGGRVDAQGIGHHIGRGEPDRGQYGFLREVDFVTGAALAITRPAWRATGGFDEQFSPAYYEDVDLCYRARNAGFRVVYVPDAVLIHKENSTLLNGGDYDAELTLHRNRLRFVLKHWSLHQLIDEFMPAEKEWLNSLGWQGEQIVAAMHRAYLEQLMHLHEIVQARRAAFPADDEEVDGLAAVLLGLRAVYPLRPANLDNPQSAPRPSNTVLTQAGPWSRLAGALRRRFPRASRAALLGPVARPLVQITNQQQLAQVLVEYIRENNREIAELAREIELLKEQIRQSQNPDK